MGPWDVTPDGQQFLMSRPTGPQTPSQLRVVLNFFTELRQRSPQGGGR